MFEGFRSRKNKRRGVILKEYSIQITKVRQTELQYEARIWKSKNKVLVTRIWHSKWRNWHYVAKCLLVIIDTTGCIKSSFFFFVWPLSPIYFRYRGLLMHLITLSDTHSVQLPWARDRPVADISASENTTFTRDRHPRAPAGFEPAIPANERQRTDALDLPEPGIEHVESKSGKLQIFLLNGKLQEGF